MVGRSATSSESTQHIPTHLGVAKFQYRAGDVAFTDTVNECSMMILLKWNGVNYLYAINSCGIVYWTEQHVKPL